MYQSYYGLNEKPFSLTPDTQFYFASLSHREALNVLLVAIAAGDGFIKITGEVGTGKTLLCRQLLHQLQDPYYSLYIPNPCLDYQALLQALVDELEISERLQGENYLKCINDRLLELANQGKTVVLVLDEAQAMPEASLEAIRLLSNLETEKHKLIQIVLFGQPELDVLLSRSSIRQLKQRIMHSYQLQPLSTANLKFYLHQRLRQAGYFGPPLFDTSALQQLYRASQGVPRLVNILANKALMLAYGSGDFYIKRGHIRQAIADTPQVTLSAARNWAWGGTLLLALTLIAGLYWVVQQ